ncbi:MAG: hypothetical protein ACE5JI_23125 [Acidobacteriota bacterium]
MSGQRRWPKPRAKREVRRGRRHGRSGARKRITVFLRAPLLKKVSRVLADHEQTLEACIEEALGDWLETGELDEETAGAGS